MTRDKLDPLDDEPTPALESETEFSDEVSPDLDEVVGGTNETMDAEPELDDQAGVEATDVAPAVSETGSLEPVASPESDYDVQQQKAVRSFFEAYRAQRAAEREALGEQVDLLPADAPLRRKDGYFYAEPRRLPPPTPFEELVFGYGKKRSLEPTPEIQERWLPPHLLPKGSQSQSTGPLDPPPEGEIKVTVEVRLTSEARERIADQAIIKAAQTHQNQTEIVAKRLYELTREIRDREAARRVLYRR